MKKRKTKARDQDLAKAIEMHRPCGEAWLRDFGDRPVHDVATGRKIARTAREYVRRRRPW